MAKIQLRDLTKRYPDGFEAVKHMDLDVEDGEFVILVGPSGCGKSTALRMIAGPGGHLRRRAGHRRPGRQRPRAQGPGHRDGLPELRAVPAHDGAREHGLRAQARQGRPGGDRPQGRARRRRSSTSSRTWTASRPTSPAGSASAWRWGARSCASPKAFLMDEPLSNLDAKLRVQMRTEVSRIQQRLGTTTIYVTHDQTEAMTLGDRVAVMRSGVLQQVATPKELYERPVNLFVAGFIGSPAMNFFRAELAGDKVRLPLGEVDAARGAARRRRAGDARHRRRAPRGLRGRRARRRAPPRHRPRVRRGHRADRVDGLGDLRLLPRGGRRGATPTSCGRSPRTRAWPTSPARATRPARSSRA